jgi:HSP20 family molecular chaperone IbpA
MIETLQVRPAFTMLPTRLFDSIFDEIGPEIGKVFQQYRPSYPADYNVETDEAGKPLRAVLTYALAGFKKDEISVQLLGTNELRITAAKKPEVVSGKSVHHGIAYRSMEDSFTLWSQSDRANIKAKFEDGLLTIVVPLEADKVVDVKID